MKGVLIYPLFFTEIEKFIHTENEEEEEEISDQQVKGNSP